MAQPERIGLAARTTDNTDEADQQVDLIVAVHKFRPHIRMTIAIRDPVTTGGHPDPLEHEVLLQKVDVLLVPQPVQESDFKPVLPPFATAVSQAGAPYQLLIIYAQMLIAKLGNMGPSKVHHKGPNQEAKWPPGTKTLAASAKVASKSSTYSRTL
jgi:hypothetical protein